MTDAESHFARKLQFETDPADVHAAPQGVLLIDTRTREAYAREHIEGAISLPHREMTAESVAGLPRDKVLVTYCWSASCNASTKGALNLARLGFDNVKELIGGIAAWKADGYATVAGTPSGAHASPG